MNQVTLETVALIYALCVDSSVSAGHVMSGPAPPSLTTSVSVIPSMFTPIASPSVSQPPLKHLTPSTRPTLPSPLVTTTSRSLIGVGKTGHLLPPELQTLPLLNPKRLHAASQLRKVKSYYDRTDTRSNPALSPGSRKNGGVLTHRESAPEFMYTPEGVVAYQSHPHVGPKPNSVSQPSPLSRDGSNIELKIEYIDQYNGPTKAGKNDKKTATAFDHKNKLLEYIHDAKLWSRDVEAKLPKRPALSLLTGQDMESSSLLLNSNVSPEEQEKFLQQHFEAIQRCSKQNVSCATQHPTSRSPISPNHVPVSLQLPTLPNPFLQLGQSGSSNLYPFLGTNPTIPTSSDYLPSIAAGLSQLASSPLNPYQAMVHLMTQQGKTQQPTMVTDASVIQNLQQGNLPPDTIPCLLPNGSIAMLSTKQLALKKETGDVSTGEEAPTSPQSTKRGRTPEMEREIPKPMPKRRRSSSLPPEVYHHNQIEKLHEQTIKEETEEHETQRTLNNTFSEGLRSRELPPLSMMHLQQDLKVIPEQMLGFPTPQSSPCPLGGFNLSQFMVSGSPYAHHHQPMTPMTPNEATGTNQDEFVESSDAQTPPPPPPEGSLPPCKQ